MVAPSKKKHMADPCILAIDLANRSFQVCVTNREGSVPYNRLISRTKLEQLFKDQPPSVVAMEACATSHFWGRFSQAFAYEVRLIPQTYVKPFVKRQKNGAADAAKIAETAARPNMHYAVVKSAEHQTRAAAYAFYIVGWCVSRTAHSSHVLDALKQAIHDRRPVHLGGLNHHIDRSSQYVSIKFTERIAEAGTEPSVGSVGDNYDNALAKSISGLYKPVVVHRRGPWRSFEGVEYATLEWVNRFNNRWLLAPIGIIPPAEAEERYYAMLDPTPMAA